MMIDYQMKVGVCLIAFYLLFKLLLSRDTLHRFNRVLLLCIVGVAIAIPFVSLPMGQGGDAAGGMVSIGPLRAVALAASDALASVALATQHTRTGGGAALLVLYLTGAAVAGGWQVASLWRLHRLLGRGRRIDMKEEGVAVHVMDGDVAPFSFFRHIVISREDYLKNPQEILAHERAHIRLGHSLDVALMNLLVVVQWWNPAAWLLKRELQQIHEFEADEAVLKEGVDARQYQLLLIRKSVGNQLFSMANNLNHNSLKRRIRMMKKQKQSLWLGLKALAIVPVAALLAVACGQKNEQAADGDDPMVVAVEVPSDAPETTVVGYATTEEEKVFDVVEQMPRFPGDEAEMMQFLSKNVKYPGEAEKKKQEGRVIATFVVEDDGTVTNAQIVRSVAPLLDAEALRVIGMMPRWEPGRQNGKAVRVKYTIPITFKLQ